MSRALLQPSVWMSRSDETVTIRTPVSSPSEYYESVLTAEEAIQLGSDLIREGLLAVYRRDANARLRKRAN